MQVLLSGRPELMELLSQMAADRHLRTNEAFARASRVEQEVQRATLASQILAKVRAFFWNVFDQRKDRDSESAQPEPTGARNPI